MIIHPPDAPPLTPEATASAAEHFNDYPAARVPTLNCYFVRRGDGAWNLTPLERTAAEDVLIHQGKIPSRDRWSRSGNGEPLSPFKNAPDVDGLCFCAMGLESVPNAPSLVNIQGDPYLNTWVRPTVVPKPGPFLIIERIIKWLVHEDVAAYEYILDWIAFKVQNPGEVPASALLFQGTPGSGKNVLFRIVSELLGPGNCTVIGEADLSRPYNAHFVTKLLVFANELVDENKRANSLNDKLKAYVTDGDLQIEAKGVQRAQVKNKIAWIAGTNNRAPIGLEADDRRWSVFVNRDETAGTDHQKLLARIHVPARTEIFTPDFLATEIPAFAHAMLTRVVDPKKIKRPFVNAAREELIKLAEPAEVQFLRELNESKTPDKDVVEYWNTGAMSAGVTVADDLLLAPGLYRLKGLHRALAGFCKDRGRTGYPRDLTLASALKEPRFGWAHVHGPEGNAWSPMWALPGKLG